MIGLKIDIDYVKQVFITNGKIVKKKKQDSGHIIDFMIPPPTNINLEEYNGMIISCKSSSRERFLQDRYIGNFILISLDRVNFDGIRSIQIGEHNKELTSFIREIRH